MKAIVTVTPRRGVLDPQGRAIATALGRMGYDEVTDARQGKVIELELGLSDPSVAEKRVKEMCDRLLANAVIEDYRVDIIE